MACTALDMSAVNQAGQACWSTMTRSDLALIMPLELAAYEYPWREQNFADCLQAAYHAQVLRLDGALLGYFVAMRGVDEVHLLNLTVAPAWQRQGWGSHMLQKLSAWSVLQGAHWLWLEVRISNHDAISLYQRQGFVNVGRRKKYYPDADGQREDALVMGLPLKAGEKGSAKIKP